MPLFQSIIYSSRTQQSTVARMIPSFDGRTPPESLRASIVTPLLQQYRSKSSVHHRTTVREETARLSPYRCDSAIRTAAAAFVG
jgi:hypothetical protein